MGRAPCCDKANVKKGPWSPEEDAKLKAYIEEYGTGGNWIALPQKIGLKRCGKSCRLRWLNYLRPNIKHGGFSEEEDNIICSLYISIGSRWSVIAAQLPGRTDNDIKNYWNTKLKKKLLGRRKQSSNINRLSSTHQEYPKESNREDHNSCGPVLSNSALERLQLHMQLQSLQNPNLSLYNNPSLWPNKLHPLQEKMIQSLQLLNQSTYNPNVIQHVPQPGQGRNGNLNEQDYTGIASLKIDEFESSLNGLLSSNAMDQSVQDDFDDLLMNKTIGFPQQADSVAEFDCFKEMDDSAKDNLIWWSNDLASKPTSSSSWDYVLGYNLQ